jgi:hypothetical protein
MRALFFIGILLTWNIQAQSTIVRNFTTTRELLFFMEQDFPKTHQAITQHFKQKYNTNDISNVASINEIMSFAKSFNEQQK